MQKPDTRLTASLPYCSRFAQDVRSLSPALPLDDLVEQCLFGSVALEPNTAHAQTARASAACKTAGSQAAGTLSVGQWLAID
ncbi:hypothetical protein [Wenzhouxiangella limi]|uniref:Uncharacterized protein n=1 Tax=Wenzhouxiangella limi TaxID=2707351 RepID=A0A845UYU7_9GAMM|nr:hypothetical protein [Wenzhouxiangella limi]NDY95060.1 hypothetical protein [Wenzhouxiangella limi]